jgi:hypothetical protein
MAKQKKVRKPKVRQPKPSDSDIEEQIQSEMEIPDNKDLPQPPPLPTYDKKFNSIHKHIMNANPETEWEEIRKWINTVPKSLNETTTMLSEQPNMTMRADRLLRLAKRELERFELDWKDATGAMRDLARDYWESRKKAGMRKQITNDMVDDYIIEKWGSTYKEMYMRLRDMKNTKEHIETMCGQVIDRAADLRRMIDQLSGKGNKPAPAWMAGQKRRKS